jgi:carbon-monoxide dehydrogenase medium subunit
MKPAPFTYLRPESLSDAVRLLNTAAGVVKPIGGGQSLGPMLNLRLVRPDLLVDVSRMDETRTAEARHDSFSIGGSFTHTELEDGILDTALDQSPALHRMLRHVAGTIAHRAIRNRGTLAGSLCHADPAADWVLAMTALDAQLHMRWGYTKFCRKTGEFAKASCAVVFDPPRGVARAAIGALDGAPALLASLAADVAKNGTARLSETAIHDAVASAVPEEDAADRQLRATVVKRCFEQALRA